MIDPTAGTSNVFLFTVAPTSGLSPGELEAGLLQRSAAFALPTRPYLDPAMLAHRILRGADGSYVWQIVFEGIDAPPEDQIPTESLDDAVRAEVQADLAGLGELVASVGYVDLSLPPPGLGFARPTDGLEAFPVDGLAGWEDHAADSGEDDAGTVLPDPIAKEIRQSRDAMRAEPGLKKVGVGHMYGGGSDHAHVAYLNGYLDARASRASAGDRRKIVAFRAFQAREGSTAAINTYDNQIVTWGTGWGGLGWLGRVMDRTVANAAVRDRFGNCGVRYRSKNVYDVVDLASKRVVTGTRDALEAVRRQVPLLYLLIDTARDPETRDAVTEAQLLTFMEGSGNFTRADEVATQALFNLIAHLKHWAPGYVTGCLDWAVPQVEGEASEDRDKQLAVLVGRYFYGKARRTKWIPDWRQFQLYWRHMRDDGLDCLSDPFIKAAAPPAGDPFATTPSKPPPAPKPAPVSTAVLKSAPIAGHADLEAAAEGKSAIRRGARGAGVKALQQALIQLEYDVPGGADGIFGGGLEGTVKAFQDDHALGVDGVVGKGTLLALESALSG